VQNFKITGGKLQIGKANAAGQPITISNVSLEVKDFSTSSQFPFTPTADMPGGGSMKLEGKAGPLAPSATPVQATLEVKKLDLASLGATSSLGLGGIGNLEGALDSDGKVAKINGTLSVDKLKLSIKGAPAGREINVKMAADYDLIKDVGTISQGDISAGKAAAQLTGNFRSEGGNTVVRMTLNAPAMPVGDIEALLPAFGIFSAEDRPAGPLQYGCAPMRPKSLSKA
jgi:AsmA protein